MKIRKCLANLLHLSSQTKIVGNLSSKILLPFCRRNFVLVKLKELTSCPSLFFLSRNDYSCFRCVATPGYARGDNDVIRYTAAAAAILWGRV